MAKMRLQTSLSPSSHWCETLGDDADHISILPDSVIHHIFSFLDVAYIVGTCILSKRWRSVWTAAPDLIFFFPWHDAPFADNLLILYMSPKVRKFHIDIDFLDYCASELSPLASLVNLHLRLLSFPFRRSVGWSNLKPLSICGSEITDKVMHEILKGGPVLECIRLEECRGLKHNVKLCSRSLTEIVVDRCFWCALDEGFPLKISSPLLLSLHLRGSFGMMRQLVIEVRSSIEAELSFFVRREDFGRRTDCSVQNWFMSCGGYCSMVEGH